MKTLLIKLFTVPILCVALFCAGCANFPAPDSIAALLAKQAVIAVAQHYGGDKAGELASAGLSAAAEVMQGYVNKQPPLQVAAASPGVTGVGQVIVNYLVDRGYVTQGVVNQIHDAAQIAANATPKK